MPIARVQHDGANRWAIHLGDHVVHVDQPDADTAPTPVELFIGALASCVAHYARGYLTRHGLPSDGLTVDVNYDLVNRPARVGPIRLDLVLPDGVPAERRDALLAVASACTVHNSLTHPPAVHIQAL